jgi:hypothetical protein
MNYQYHIFSMMNRVFDVLIIPTFNLFVFQVLLLIFFLNICLYPSDYLDGDIGIMTLHSSFLIHCSMG